VHAEGERYVETESGWVKLVHVVTMVGPGVSVAVVESRMVVLGKPLSGQTGKEGACSHGREVNGGGGVAAVGERHERYPSIEFHLVQVIGRAVLEPSATSVQ